MTGTPEIIRSRDWEGTQGPNRVALVDHGSDSDCSLGAEGRDLIGYEVLTIAWVGDAGPLDQDESS